MDDHIRSKAIMRLHRRSCACANNHLPAQAITSLHSRTALLKENRRLTGRTQIFASAFLRPEVVAAMEPGRFATELNRGGRWLPLDITS